MKIMKSLKFLIAVTLLISVSACCVDAQFRKTVRGEGPVVKESRQASPFDEIRVSTGIDVYLKQGNDHSISVEADENLHEYIRTEVNAGVLHVYTDANIREAKMKRVYVTMKDVRSLKTSSAGDIIGETPVKGNDIEISASSAGDIKLEVYANDLDINISSSGNIRLSGEAETMNADLSSAGDLEAYGLVVKDADVNVSSAGDAQVNVTERLVARASSAGDISYQGNPRQVDARASSAGGIRKR
jgi:hypothetical protein